MGRLVGVERGEVSVIGRLVSGISPRVAGFAPFLGLVLMAFAIPLMMSVADWRLSAAPWLLGFAVLSLAVCCLGVLNVHRPDPKRSVLFGTVLAALSFGGLAVFPFAVGIGGLLGIEEDAAGILAYLPLIAAGFGFAAMTPALVTAAVGVGASGVLPRWGVWALWIEAPLLLLTTIGGGQAEPVLVIGFALIPVGWAVIGASLIITTRTAPSRT